MNKNTFKRLTVYLLRHKYLYYVTNAPEITDYGYDMKEREWYKMGLELGELKEGEHTPCIGFDENHPFAKTAKNEAWDRILNFYLDTPNQS